MSSSSLFIMLNVANKENLVEQEDNNTPLLCLSRQEEPFATETFYVENLEGVNVSSLAKGVKYRLKWSRNGQYLQNIALYSCFIPVVAKEEASLWEDLTGENKRWIVTTSGKEIGINVSILASKSCTTCPKGQICNYYTGLCENCLECSSNCLGPCQNGGICELDKDGLNYKCVTKNNNLLYLYVLLGVLAFVFIVIIITVIATK